MNNTNLDSLMKKITKITLIPLGTICLIVVIPILFYFINHSSEVSAKQQSIIKQVINNQMTLLAQEFYFQNKTALSLRLQQIVESISNQSDQALSYCLQGKGQSGEIISSFPKNCNFVDSKPNENSETKIFIGNEEVGSISYMVTTPLIYWVELTFIILLVLAIALLATKRTSSYFLNKLKQDIVLPLLAEIQEKGRFEAIANINKVIAHDVKRPIVMATMIVNILENIKSISELESLIPMFRSNLKKATDDISGVLEDITLIGGTVDMSNETTVPLEVIHESIEAFRDTDNRAQYKEVTFKIEILTELSLLGEKRRWKRSLINLFENAAKASNGMSEVSIKVENVGGTSAGTLKVNVHNTNSFIPDEIIQKIMIGSYSGNGGTGLGLTMIRGMVKSIGGTISCSSNSKHGTSFVLAVPGRKTSSSLPIDHKSSIPNIQSVQINHLPRGPYSNKDFVGLVEALKRKLRVFIIDDETSYADIVSQSIKSNEAISSYIEIAHFKGREDLTACLTRVSLPADIYIVDMNYETHEYDGIDIIREIKRSVPNALVCLCSNHIDHYSRTKAKESGADWVIPKPISAEHIIKMLGERLENQQPSSNSLLEPCRAEIIESDFRKIVLMKSVLQKENVQFSFFNSLAEFLESDKNTSSANVFLSDASKNDMISSIEGKIVGNNDSVPASFRQLIKEAAHGN